MARPPKRMPPVPKADRTQKIMAELYASTVRCPSCGHAMPREDVNVVICCVNPYCKMRGQRFKVLMVELVPVKEPGPDHKAKVKELRELLLRIEWLWVSASVVVCPVCHRRNDHVPGRHFQGKHLSSCRLKAEIDKLESEETN